MFSSSNILMHEVGLTGGMISYHHYSQRNFQNGHFRTNTYLSKCERNLLGYVNYYVTFSNNLKGEPTCMSVIHFISFFYNTLKLKTL